MDMRFERTNVKTSTELDSARLETLHLEQQKPRVRMAALCKAILDPRYFDNSKFWHYIYKNGLNVDFLKRADGMAFVNGVGEEEYFLGSSADVDYFARWPMFEEVIVALKPHLTKEETSKVIFDCHHDINQNPISRNLLERIIERVYVPEFDYSQMVHAPYSQRGSAETFIDNKFLGLQRTFHTSSASIWLKVLSGFMAALGSAAVLLALTSLTFPAAPVAAVAGAAFLAGSFGLFKHADKMPLVMEEHEQPRFQL